MQRRAPSFWPPAKPAAPPDRQRLSSAVLAPRPIMELHFVSETPSTVDAAEAAVAAIQGDIATLIEQRADLFGRLPAMRSERTDAARASLLNGGSRKTWETALRLEQETHALVADIDAVIAILERDLSTARHTVVAVKREHYRAALQLRLQRVASEHDFAVLRGATFHDAATAYDWLAKVGRTDEVDHTRYHSYWLDLLPTRGVSLASFVLAAAAHGDIRVEVADHGASFGITKYGGRPAKSLPLSDAPTQSSHRALISKVKLSYAR